MAKLIVRPIRVMLVFGVVLLLAYGMFSAFPGVFCPRRIKATLSSWCSCRMARQSNGPTWCWSGSSDFPGNPAVHSTDALSGQNFVFGTRGPNAATMFVPLHLWDERKEPQYHVQSLIGMAYGIRQDP